MTKRSQISLGLFAALFFFSAWAQAAPKIEYKLSMPEPYTHYFEVEMKVSNLKTSYIDLKMPVWAPGSYLVREFAKSVEGFQAMDANGNPLKSEKTDKATWRIQSKKAKSVTARYRVYAYELSVRTSFLDASHGYLNGTSVFMYVAGQKKTPVTVTVKPYKEWKKVNTGLDPVPGKKFTYSAPNYDVLADAPFEIGNQREFHFESKGVKFTVAMYGKADYNENTLKAEMKKVVDACSDVFGGDQPNKDYTFIVHNLSHGGGGLEHLNSTTLQVNRWAYATKGGMQSFLSLVCHEYIHVWNVKRLRPKSLGPFDYQSENYTTLLWVSEGITSYYDELLLERTGILSKKEYLGRLKNGIGSIENQPGQRVQPLAMSSFDTWIKAYRPNENSYNTTISYYTKGSVVAAMLDLAIIDATDGKKKLDDVMLELYRKTYLKNGSGFTERDFVNTVNQVAGKSMDDFFKNYIHSTKQIPYNEFFDKVGIKMIDRNKGRQTRAYLGAMTSERGGKLTITRVIRGTSAYENGLNVNDEIIAVDGFRVNSSELSKLIGFKRPGETAKVTISRDGLLMDINVTLKADNRANIALMEIENPTDRQKRLKEFWLKKN
ncbi:peptidase M61 [Fulvitalea axinellae]|uniref:Peptidase M61 n=1 Tax=Fulvitalea axinellae TaxID=1182444 RepID=A0AAU9CL98_9BACT|nr:peptidase M61 [Fulvitalea axinellae]